MTANGTGPKLDLPVPEKPISTSGQVELDYGSRGSDDLRPQYRISLVFQSSRCRRIRSEHSMLWILHYAIQKLEVCNTFSGGNEITQDLS